MATAKKVLGNEIAVSARECAEVEATKAQTVAAWEALRAQVSHCTCCPLHEGRTQVVFGGGNVRARVMIIGEAPGKNEDLQGEPFVGAAGKYLNELLAAAGLTRDEVYIANVLKCRPPANRNPKPEEIHECAPYLREQTRLLAPEYVVTLGNFATKFILKTDEGITRLRGNLHLIGNLKVLPVFHPAAAIYDRKKRDVLAADFAYLGTLLATATSSS
jgi:DNA polymerase